LTGGEEGVEYIECILAMWSLKTMPQLHFYVPEETAEILRKRAESQGMSLSRYLAKLVQTEVPPEWPEGFFEEVVGGWRGEPLERPPQGEYEDREALGQRGKE
jgi:hypothetical protein